MGSKGCEDFLTEGERKGVVKKGRCKKWAKKMGLTSAKSIHEERFIHCFASSFLTSSFSAVQCSLLVSASALCWTKQGHCDSLPRCYQIIVTCFLKYILGRIDRALLASCCTWKCPSLIISWERINEVWRGTWISSFLKKSFSRRCTGYLKKMQPKCLVLQGCHLENGWGLFRHRERHLMVIIWNSVPSSFKW